MNWLRAVHEADNAQDLLAIVNEFLLAYPDAYWSWIPREARPRLVATVPELHEWHRRLSGQLGAAASPNIRMQDLAVFFLQASARAIDLESTQPCSNQDDCSSREAG